MMPREKTWADARLEDIVIAGATIEGLYGFDHKPAVPNDAAEADALFAKIAEELKLSFSHFAPLKTLPALAILATATQPGSRPVFLDQPAFEFAQAAFLLFGGGDASPSFAEITILCNNLCQFRALFLQGATKIEPNTREWSLRQRQSNTLNVRHTHYGRTTRHLAELIAKKFGDRYATQLGFTLLDAYTTLFETTDFIIESIESRAASEVVSKWMQEMLADRCTQSSWNKILDLFRVHNETEILDNLSSKLGGLGGVEFAHISLDNPVWSAPFVSHNDCTYLFYPDLIYAFYDLQFARILGNASKQANEELGGARGAVLQAELAASLQKLFPSARLVTEVKWTDFDTGNEYETDAIVIFDDLLLIFEAKGTQIAAAGRRGSNTYFASFDKAVVNATIQAERLKVSIEKTQNDFELRSEGIEEPVSIKKLSLDRIVRFGVTLERFAAASYDADEALWGRVKRLGIDPMPILTIGDLENYSRPFTS